VYCYLTNYSSQCRINTFNTAKNELQWTCILLIVSYRQVFFSFQTSLVTFYIYRYWRFTPGLTHQAKDRVVIDENCSVLFTLCQRLKWPCIYKICCLHGYEFYRLWIFVLHITLKAKLQPNRFFSVMCPQSCKNGGVCKLYSPKEGEKSPHESPKAVCKCKAGFEGNFCEKEALAKGRRKWFLKILVVFA